MAIQSRAQLTVPTRQRWTVNSSRWLHWSGPPVGLGEVRAVWRIKTGSLKLPIPPGVVLGEILPPVEKSPRGQGWGCIH